MNRSLRIYRLTVAALLVAVGILIPMFMPLKVYIPPMSFTLASHVVIFIAMFLSPMTALAVAVGTTVGFVFSGLPVDVWLRALSHVVWAVLGALWLRRRPGILYRPVQSGLFCLAVAAVHALLELTVIFTLFFGGFGGVAEKFQEAGYVAILLLVGLGTVIHSTVDYILSLLVWRPLRRLPAVKGIASVDT